MNEEEQDIQGVYDDEAREDLVENDEISPEEEGFMAGYEDQKEKISKKLEGDEAYESAFQEPKKPSRKK
ncbi:hypothetical protein K9L97_00120 [Candidatus Woesearchaeota archaeon]|nr:hypothetical protein [Candidatus Woesearchaeota archaeon]